MLILVRHGRTQANAAGLLQGRIDLSLDEVGVQQASRIGEVLREVHGHDLRVVASPLQRARETAARIADDVVIDERWQEIAYGVYEGRPLADLGAAQWARWRSDPHFAVEGGESLSALMSRVQEALDDLVEQAQERDVVVVSHVSPIKAAIAWALGTGVEISWRCQLDQAAISKIAIGPHGPSLRSFNDTSHL